MNYQEYLKPYNEEVEERTELVVERIKEIPEEHLVQELYQDYFTKAANQIARLEQAYELVNRNLILTMPEETLRKINHDLYQDVEEQAYETSYANPVYAVKMFGMEMGQLLSYLYTQIINQTEYAFQGNRAFLTYTEELFVQVYNCFEEPEQVTPEEIEKAISSFAYDYLDVFTKFQTSSQVDPELDFVQTQIIGGDLTDLRYLYLYGKYITENEIETARFLNLMEESKVQAMADTFTEGYRIGFVNGGKDLSRKKSVCIYYHVGFERMIHLAMKNFKKMGLETCIRCTLVNTTSPNRQWQYDHKDDAALYLDKAFIERKLECMHNTYEEVKEKALAYGGPAVIETFGEKNFDPVNHKENLEYSEKQNQLNVYFQSMAGKMVNEYIPGDQRSFTIISYPIPEVGEKFQEIFAETVKINTLDYTLYQKMQQKMIDVLDQGEMVHITGRGDNKTDLYVALHPIQNPEKESVFENCVADVNIPVGEVFTSPKLNGTNGLLHVTKVYLNGLKFLDLSIQFKDGMIASYDCGNFPTAEENHKYMFDNVLFKHDTIPMGEFAIGTNTTAYRMGIEYDIQGKLPILIAEKTGPHFAVGDTCYSQAEDMKVYNPDGKEIVARDNEITLANRKDDPMKAYFNCHTDITIPYDELDCITVIKKDGTKVNVIENGLFVVPGTEILNEPLQ